MTINIMKTPTKPPVTASNSLKQISDVKYAIKNHPLTNSPFSFFLSLKWYAFEVGARRKGYIFFNTLSRHHPKKQERLASLALKRDLSGARTLSKKCFELFQNASNFSRRCLSAFGTNPRPALPLRRARQINYQWKQKINVSIHGEHTRDTEIHRKRLFGCEAGCPRSDCGHKSWSDGENPKRFPLLGCHFAIIVI